VEEKEEKEERERVNIITDYCSKLARSDIILLSIFITVRGRRGRANIEVNPFRRKVAVGDGAANVSRGSLAVLTTYIVCGFVFLSTSKF
jgi:hypothetical protein